MTTAEKARRQREAAEAIMRDYAEQIRAQQSEHMRDAFAYGMGAASFRHGAGGFRYQRHAPEDLYQRPPLHDAIDFTQGDDGVWRLPVPIVFGFDFARPGSDTTAYWSFSR